MFKRLTPQTKSRLQIVAPWVVLALILLVSFWIRSRHLWLRAMTYDEGHWLMFAALANKGYTPYSTIFVGIPPLALLSIQLGAKLFDITLGVRYPMMLYSLVGITALFLIFRPWKSLFGLIAGFLAAIFLSFDLDNFRESSTFMGEVPSVSLVIVSFLLAQQYVENSQWFWLLLSGVAFGLSLALKIFTVFFPPFMAMFIVITLFWSGQPAVWGVILRRIAVAGVIWGLGLLIPWGIFLLIYDPWGMYEQTFLFRLAFRDVNLSQYEVFRQNSAEVVKMILNRWPLVIGAVAGIFIGWRERRLDTWVWLLWFCLATGPLVWQAPLRPRYSVILLPPLAALSAIALTCIIYWLFRWWQKKQLGWLGGLLVTILLFIIVGLSFTIPARGLARTPDPYTFPNLNFEVVDYVEHSTMPDDCIVTDDQRFAFAIERLVPAALSETAQGRLATGWLTSEQIVAEIQAHDCPAVVYMVDYFETFLPDLRDELRKLYFLEINYDQNFTLFTAKKNVERQPGLPLEVQIGQNIMLRGVDLTPLPWVSGQEVKLGTYWMTQTKPEKSYKIFVQLRNQRNETVASFDYFPFAPPNDRYRLLPEFEYHYRVTPTLEAQSIPPEEIALYPQKGMVPTIAWPIGNVLREVTTLSLPDLTPGIYNLHLGLYDPDTLERLTAHASPETDAVLLGQIEVVEKTE